MVCVVGCFEHIYFDGWEESCQTLKVVSGAHTLLYLPFKIHHYFNSKENFSIALRQCCE
jgi:hypothetical protein